MTIPQEPAPDSGTPNLYPTNDPPGQGSDEEQDEGTDEDLARVLEAYGAAIAHRAALEGATLLGYRSPYPATDAAVLLRRAAQDLARALWALRATPSGGTDAEQDTGTEEDP